MDTPAVLARALTFAAGGGPLVAGLSFDIGPGLTWVRGGEGRGKTTLLRLLAGQLAPTAGTLARREVPCWFEDPTDPAAQDTVAAAWLDARRARHRGWDPAVQQRLAAALGLDEHLGKPLYMLSNGSRRKVGLVGAAACGAPLTLIDMPFAALDAGSVRVMTGLFAEAAADRRRAWVVADHECPDGLRGTPLIDLGD